jgi:hypothetical protein
LQVLSFVADLYFLTATEKMIMMACSFQKLVQLLDNELNVDDKLEVLDHVDFCPICRDAVYQIVRDRDEKLFVAQSHNAALFMNTERPRPERFNNLP